MLDDQVSFNKYLRYINKLCDHESDVIKNQALSIKNCSEKIINGDSLTESGLVSIKLLQKNIIDDEFVVNVVNYIHKNLVNCASNKKYIWNETSLEWKLIPTQNI